MLKVVISVCVSMFVGATTALACAGDKIGRLRAGEKVVGIELIPTNKFGEQIKKAKSEWAMDDDGFLTLAFAASYCQIDVPRAEVKLTIEQGNCVSSAQERIARQSQIHFNHYDPSYENYLNAQEAIQTKCGIDAMARWKEVNAAIYEAPLPCVEQVRGIVMKAAARHAEYVKEQSDPKYLARIGLTPAQRRTHLKALDTEHLLAQNFADLTASTPLKMGFFNQWVGAVQPIFEQRQYQVVASPDGKYDPDKNESLTEILRQVGSGLPFIPRGKCMPRFSKEMIQAFQGNIWEPRIAAPGVQGGAGVKQ